MAIEYSDLILSEAALVSYWRLGEASTGVPAVDEAGVADGAYNNSPVNWPTVGQAGLVTDDPDTSVQFATGGKVVVPDNSAYHVGDHFSVEFLLDLTTVDFGGLSIFNMVSGSDGFKVDVASVSGSDRIRLSSPSAPIVTTATAFGSARHHVIVTKDGPDARIYIDGVEASLTAGTPATLTSAAAGITFGNYVHGYVDEVAFYNAALTPEQAALHAAAALNTAPEFGDLAPVETSAFSATLNAQVNTHGDYADQPVSFYFTATPQNGGPSVISEKGTLPSNTSVEDASASMVLPGYTEAVVWDFTCTVETGYSTHTSVAAQFISEARTARPVTELEQEMLDTLPHFIANDNTIRGIIHAYAVELQLAHDRLDNIIEQSFPSTADDLLAAWELTFKLPVNDPAKDLTQRRASVAAAFLNVIGDPSATHVQTVLTALLGSSYRYVEYDPDDPSNTPTPYTILILTSSPLGAEAHGNLMRLLRRLIPANTDIQITTEDGFILDTDHLDTGVL